MREGVFARRRLLLQHWSEWRKSFRTEQAANFKVEQFQGYIAEKWAKRVFTALRRSAEQEMRLRWLEARADEFARKKSKSKVLLAWRGVVPYLRAENQFVVMLAQDRAVYL